MIIHPTILAAVLQGAADGPPPLTKGRCGHGQDCKFPTLLLQRCTNSGCPNGDAPCVHHVCNTESPEWAAADQDAVDHKITHYCVTCLSKALLVRFVQHCRTDRVCNSRREQFLAIVKPLTS